VFDLLEDYFDIFGQLQTDFMIKAANIEKGEVSTIYTNTTVGYPSYSRLDDKILFTYNNGQQLLATIDVQPNNKILPVNGTDVILINGAQKGVWFTAGDRIFTATEAVDSEMNTLEIIPNPVSDFISFQVEGLHEGLEFSIVDMQGISVVKGRLNADMRVPVEGLLSGTYSLNLLQNDGRVYHGKFVKQ
jgi:hypothetical protein